MATSRRAVQQHEDWLILADAEAPWFLAARAQAGTTEWFGSDPPGGAGGAQGSLVRRRRR